MVFMTALTEQELERIKELESHSRMLGRICALVEPFAEEDDTTEHAVRRIIAELYMLRADSILEPLTK